MSSLAPTPMVTRRTTAYDAAGNVTARSDALNHTTAYSYDALDRPITTTDALSNTTTYGYDALDRTSAITYADGTAPNVRYT